MSNVVTKIQKSRAGLILEQPFFASLLLPMPLIEDSSIPTMGTDGEKIIFNPDFTNKLTQSETTFVLAHEVLHCVFDHMGRRGNRDPNKWNIAADYIINDLLKKEKIGTMPQGCLYDPSLVAKGGGTADGVYNILPPPPKNGKGGGGYPGAGEPGGALDKVMDSGPDEATQKEKEVERRIKIINARRAAKSQGKLSGALNDILEQALEPQVDWRNGLRRFITERAKVEYSFARPKRRFVAEDLFLPSLAGQKMGFVTIAVDCSGSISTKLLEEFAAEINAIREDVHPSAIEIVYFDARVTRSDRFEADDELVISPRGGGGTMFSPVFKHINDQAELPVACIFLTDLYCNDFGPAPEYPVMWCCIEGAPKGMTVPFGEILKVKADG